MNPQVERAVEHFRALLEEQIARAERLEEQTSSEHLLLLTNS